MHDLTCPPRTKDASTAFVAVITALTLTCTLLAALLVLVYDELSFVLSLVEEPPHRVDDFFGADSAFSLTVLILSFNFGVLTLALCVLLYQVNRQTSLMVATLRLQASGQPPELSLGPSKRWHLFLSHNWANQDAVATIKRQLQLLLPGVQIFLDVDDLESIDHLEAYVEASAALLVLLGKETYFHSRNCMRELDAAVVHDLPLVRLHDWDVQKNGAPLAQLRHACPAEHRELLFGSEERPVEVVTWHRMAEFQVVSVREAGVHASPVSTAGTACCGGC